jgi:hypothetical protein
MRDLIDSRRHVPDGKNNNQSDQNEDRDTAQREDLRRLRGNPSGSAGECDSGSMIIHSVAGTPTSTPSSITSEFPSMRAALRIIQEE